VRLPGERVSFFSNFILVIASQLLELVEPACRVLQARVTQRGYAPTSTARVGAASGIAEVARVIGHELRCLLKRRRPAAGQV